MPRPGSRARRRGEAVNAFTQMAWGPALPSSWCELAPRARLRLLVHVPATELRSPDAAVVSEAVARHFNYRAERARGDLRQLFRTGRVALAIGLGVLAFCMVAGRVVSMGHSDLGRYFAKA